MVSKEIMEQNDKDRWTVGGISIGRMCHISPRPKSNCLNLIICRNKLGKMTQKGEKFSILGILTPCCMLTIWIFPMESSYDLLNHVDLRYHYQFFLSRLRIHVYMHA